ncbi:MAG: pantoate--beta-alanine ligase [Acidobacteriota bacterium]
MQIIHSPEEMQAAARRLTSEGKEIAFVPTMGYLHEGHLSLLRAGRKAGDILVLSIFVNPLQFGEGEDLSVYPRDLDCDRELACSRGTDIVFSPSVKGLYPDGFSTCVEVKGLTEILCGHSRPNHFRGVTTVVCKLLNLVCPSKAFFGQKDYQQLTVIRRMVSDLNMGVEIVSMPIVREPDGLAMSSRNVYLDPNERRQALSLVESILLARAMYKEGERRAEEILDRVRTRIEMEPSAKVDYAQICHRDTLKEMDLLTEESMLLLAAYVGQVRLIDNHQLGMELGKNDPQNA